MNLAVNFRVNWSTLAGVRANTPRAIFSDTYMKSLFSATCKGKVMLLCAPRLSLFTPLEQYAQANQLSEESHKVSVLFTDTFFTPYRFALAYIA